MGFFKFGKKKSDCFLALDIGEEAVKALIFKKDKENFVILANSCDKNIRKAMEAVQKETGLKPKEVFLSLPTDILKGRVVWESFSRNNAGQIINKKEKENIDQTVLGRAKAAIAQNFFQHSGILSQELEFTELRVLEQKVDGYSVQDLNGYKGKHLEFRIFASFALKFYLNDLKKELGKFRLESLKILHKAQTIVLASQQKESVFIGIEEESTQIFLVRNGILSWSAEFDRGSADFSKLLYNTFGFSGEAAKDFTERYINGELSEQVRARFHEMFLELANEWLADLKLKLKEFNGFFPANFVIFGQGAELSEIQEALESQDWQIELLYLKLFKNIIDSTHTLGKPRDAGLVSLCYING